MTTRQASGVVLTVILVGAFTLRYLGIEFGFPVLIHPDEPHVANAAARIAETGNLDPETFLYPSLFIYMQSAVFAAITTLGSFAGTFESISHVPVTTLYYWGRMLTIVLSVMTIYLTYLAARETTRAANRDIADRVPIAALVAALLVGVSFLHVSNSFMITTDSPMAFWVLLSVAGSLLIVTRGPKPTYYLTAAAAAGLAGGTKYNAVFCVVPLIIAHFAAAHENGLRRDGRLLAALLVVGLAFIATTPYALLDPSEFFGYLALQRTAYGVSHPGAESSGYSYGFYTATLVQKFGAVPLLAALAGVVSLTRSQPRVAAVTLSFPLTYFAFMGLYRVHFDRNMVVLVPFAALFAGLGYAALLDLWRRQTGDGPKEVMLNVATWIVIGLSVFAVYGQGAMSLAHAKQITLPNTRWISKVWIERHLPFDSKIALEFYTPPVNDKRYSVTALGLCGLIRTDDLEQYDYLVASSQDFRRFLTHPDRYPAEAQRYREVFGRYELVKFFRPEQGRSYGPAIRIYKTH